MTRYPDWASRLEAFLLAQQERRFAYGSFDCCLFVCDAIEVMTGKDPGSAYRGKYDSAKSAASMIYKATGCRTVGGIVETTAAGLMMPEISPAHARRGDVALIRRGRDASLGIAALDGRNLIVAGAKGLLRITRLQAVRSWSV